MQPRPRKAMSFVLGLALSALLIAAVSTFNGIPASFIHGHRARLILLKAKSLIYPGQLLKYRFGELDERGRIYETDKAEGHHYTEVYEYFLCPIKYSAKKVLEIGIETGASLKMWADYFPGATIYGIDIADKSRLNSKTIRTFVADQADRKRLQACLDASGGDFDFIVDDGGHSMEQQQVSFGFLFSQVRPGGYYIVEDLHTSIYAYYDSGYGAAKTGGNTTLTMVDNFIRTGTIKSDYMTAGEQDYLTAHLGYCNLFSRDRGHSITCIFKKK
jgi:hypothetical protein